MRSLFFVTAISLAFVAEAVASPTWTKLGWYVVAETQLGHFLSNGPFEDKDSCEAALPDDEDAAKFTCEFFKERPDFDDK